MSAPGALDDAAEDRHGAPGRELGPFERSTYNFLHFVARVLVLVYFRAYARGSDGMPRSGKVIISPVHRSNLDVPLLGATCPRRLRYLAKGSLFRNRFWAWFLTVIGGFPLEREALADRGALKAAMRVLERGEALVVFPEGERKSGPTVYPMADGAVWLAARTGAPILPVGIGGSEQALPKGSLVPKPRRLVFLYGELMEPPQPAPGARRVSRSQLHEYSGRLRENLQELFDRAQVLAGAPNPPPAQRPPLPG
jgi:1-acyl-sn-glycerol-3-phosphate acyltransferase